MKNIFRNRIVSRLVQKKPSGSAAGPRAPTMGELTLNAQELAASIPALVARSQEIAHAMMAGQHGRRRPGMGEHFWQYRPALPGEPTHRIDWRLSARSQRAFVRETEWETAQLFALWCDFSASMYWRSHAEQPQKIEQALVITLTLAIMLLARGERVMLLDAQPASGQAALTGQAALQQIIFKASQKLAAPQTEPHTGPALSWHGLPRHARLFLIGDFLDEESALAEQVRQAVSYPLKTHLVQILDPAEWTLPYRGHVCFMGMEGEEPATLPGVEALGDDYAALFRARQERLIRLCQEQGAIFLSHRTDQPLSHTILALYQLLKAERLV